MMATTIMISMRVNAFCDGSFMTGFWVDGLFSPATAEDKCRQESNHTKPSKFRKDSLSIA